MAERDPSKARPDLRGVRRPARPGALATDPHKKNKVAESKYDAPAGLWIEVSTDGHQRCTAKCKSTGVQCRNWSMPGRGNCKFHGGATPLRGDGRVSKYAVGRLAENIRTYSNDPHIKSLRDEIGLVRGLLGAFLDRTQTLAEDGDDAAALLVASEPIMAMTDQIRKLAVSLTQIEEGLRLTLDVSQVKGLAAQFVQIISEEVTEPETRKRIATRIATLEIGARA